MSKFFYICLLIAVGIWVALAFHLMPYKIPDGTVYEMPVECNIDLSVVTGSTLVFNQPQSSLAIWNRFLKIAPEGWRLFAVTVNLPGFDPFIIIDESLPEPRYGKALHHERCHIIAGAWHG